MSGSPSVDPVMPARGYAGDITPRTAWAWVQSGEAMLIDVRTEVEMQWVGYVPGSLGLPWKNWPDMSPNPDFDPAIQSVAPGKKLVLLCRSGVRSVAAATRATELGREAYNILEGFEGDIDEQGQRGHLGGWRFHGLPWQQH